MSSDRRGRGPIGRQFCVSQTNVAERVMCERPRELTDVGLIVREVDPGPPTKSTYMATERAADVQLRIDELRTALGHDVRGQETT